jgi:hypothetical protein
MTKMRFFHSLALLFFILPSISLTREIPPFVSTDWLEQNLSSPGVLIIEVNGNGQQTCKDTDTEWCSRVVR